MSDGGTVETTIWVVEVDSWGDGTYVHGVYSTEEKARAAIDALPDIRARSMASLDSLVLDAGRDR